MCRHIQAHHTVTWSSERRRFAADETIDRLEETATRQAMLLDRQLCEELPELRTRLVRPVPGPLAVPTCVDHVLQRVGCRTMHFDVDATIHSAHMPQEPAMHGLEVFGSAWEHAERDEC